MSERITLPPGCAGFTTADGRTLKAKPGSSIVLEDGDAKRLLNSGHVSAGVISRQSHRLGTKHGRWCVECRRLWQGWSYECPKCGELTVPEEFTFIPASPLPADMIVNSEPRRWEYSIGFSISDEKPVTAEPA